MHRYLMLAWSVICLYFFVRLLSLFHWVNVCRLEDALFALKDSLGEDEDHLDPAVPIL